MCHDVTSVCNVDVSNASAYFAFTIFSWWKKKKTVPNQQFERMDTEKKKKENQERALYMICIAYTAKVLENKNNVFNEVYA